jgi:phage/plasmid-like protein (TIGR03299 family)
MSANFTSGIFARGLPAWHNEGIITDVMGVEEAFTRGGARFEVEKRPLSFQNNEGLWLPTDRYAVVRTDNLAHLGTVAKDYEIVQNERLEQIAEAVSGSIEMDAVVVLDEGRKVAFTGLIKDTEIDVIPGDPIHRFLVGWLGHDGKTAVGNCFTNTRVVCQNTLEVAMGSQVQQTLCHSSGVNKVIDALIGTIDIARRSFRTDVEAFQVMAAHQLANNSFNQVMEATFTAELLRPMIDEDGISRPRQVGDLRITKHVLNAMYSGLGTDIAGVRGSVWGLYNGITEVLTSTAEGGVNSIQKFNRVMFGTNRQRIDRAREACLKLCA